eukprot:gene19277-25916_t
MQGIRCGMAFKAGAARPMAAPRASVSVSRPCVSNAISGLRVGDRMEGELVRFRKPPGGVPSFGGWLHIPQPNPEVPILSEPPASNNQSEAKSQFGGASRPGLAQFTLAVRGSSKSEGQIRGLSGNWSD